MSSDFPVPSPGVPGNTAWVNLDQWEPGDRNEPTDKFLSFLLSGSQTPVCFQFHLEMVHASGRMYFMLKVWATGASPPVICYVFYSLSFPLHSGFRSIAPPKKTACKFHLHFCFLGKPAKKTLIYISVSCLDSPSLCSPLFILFQARP